VASRYVVRRADVEELGGGREGVAAVRGGREMVGALLLLRQRLVRDALEQVLEEPVLATLGGAWIRLEGERLLADERREQRIEVRLGRSAERGESGLRERLADDRRVLDHSALLGGEPVEARGDESVQ